MTVPPLFSVIIPTYNRAVDVCWAIESCLRQTEDRLEILVVDDGSTDGTDEAIRNRFEDPRIIVIQQSNSGASEARNNGVRHASGKYVAFLDSDDTFLPEKLEHYLTHRELLDQGWLIYSQVLVCGHKKQRIKPRTGYDNKQNIFRHLFVDGGFVPTPTMVLKKDVAESVQWNSELAYGDDTDYVVRLHLAGTRFFMIDKPLSIVDDTGLGDRLSLNKDPLSLNSWVSQYKDQMSKATYAAYEIHHIAFAGFWGRPVYYLGQFSKALLNPNLPKIFVVKCLVRAMLPTALYRRLISVFLPAS